MEENALKQTANVFLLKSVVISKMASFWGGTSLTMGCQSPAQLTCSMVIIVYSENKQHSTAMELSIVIARGSTSFCSYRYGM